ncbi:MAG: UvrD-helicase domain-containing protein [Endomicrobia bacterium]|nr:UvrD-helicase domain-containing protein [Endomicrobiia bacterium]
MKKENSQIILTQASAGSGKTYSLAKRYIYLLLNSDGKNSFKNIIAVTFANKAAVEMKYRIINYLKKAALSLDTEGIFDGAWLTQRQARAKSREMLSAILKDYDGFNISTIDSFINRILKACAFNLGISPNFTVEKEYSDHLYFALDSFLRASSSSHKSRELLIDYISQYLITDKTGWFPRNDIYDEIAKVFSKAGNSGKEIAVNKSDFKTRFPALCSKAEEKIKTFFEKFSNPGIYSSHIKAAEKVLSEGSKIFYSGKIPKVFAESGLKYKKGAQTDRAADELWAEISAAVKELCAFYAANYYGIYSQIYSQIEEEFEGQAKKDELVFLNGINRKAVKFFENNNGIMPEVYYRLSEKYKHFLIDEFQDTSPVQWSGIKRFLEESLAGGGTFFYVGDAKQAIYDFRGGNSGIFYSAAGKFAGIECDSVILGENYRSRREIVEFNNKIFSRDNIERYLAETYGDKDGAADYGELFSVYDASRQNCTAGKDKGYVEIDIVPQECGDEEKYTKEKFTGFVKQALERFEAQDIAVLCRTNGEAALSGTWLLESGIDVESVQTLNIRNDGVIKQIISLLKFINSPSDELSFASFLVGEIFARRSGINTAAMEEFLFSRRAARQVRALYRDFALKYDDVWKECFEELFSKTGFTAVYELAVFMMEKFQVIENFPQSKAFVMRFLELINAFEQDDSGLKNFLEHFDSLEDKDEALYVKSGSGRGVKVTTVHRAKGLEFPVVILPFLKLAAGRTDKPYFDDSGEKINLLGVTKNLSEFSPEIKNIYDSEKAKSLLSEMNVLYVSMTRAECEMYAIAPTKAGASKNGAVALLGNAGLVCGAKEKYVIKRKHSDIVSDEADSGYKDIEPHYGTNASDLSLSELRMRGNMIHFALSRIITLRGKNLSDEISRAVKDTAKKFISEDAGWLKAELESIFNSPEISELFGYDESCVFNEKEIVNSSGDTFRIDKLINNGGEIIIADFKSSQTADAAEQVRNYAACIAQIYPEAEISALIADLSSKKTTEVEKLGS